MILWRYILRAHLGPFLFSNAIIIFLFLLQFLMKSAGDLVGKGLSAHVIFELIALNLAWMVVLAVPMSVLVASLMAFGRMSSDNEIVIMRAGGMSLYRMMIPVFIAAGVLTWGLIIFNNRILPEANIRLRTLMTDILRIKPTLSLQSGVFTTEDQLPNYRILVRRTFEKSNDLEGVTIFDLSQPEKSVIVTAKRGRVSFSPDYTRIVMDLQDGEINEMNLDNQRSYRRIRFIRHRVAIPASGFGFQRSDAATAQRDDRTMSASMMREIVDSTARLLEEKQSILDRRLHDHFTSYLRRAPALAAVSSMAGDTGRNASHRPALVDSVGAWDRTLIDARQMQSRMLSDLAAMSYDERQIDKYLVEIYKKYSIPFACMVFVLIGAPLGMMARRGGFGVGAGFSLGFFLFYWACLIGGEKLADRDIFSPFLGMWLANFVLGACGVLLTIRSAREAAVIDWSRVQRILPKSWRRHAQQEHFNPHEA